MAMVKNDKYRRARGGRSTFYNIACVDCGLILCEYQKDGRGQLRRLYIDRMNHIKVVRGSNKVGKCENCNNLIGYYYIYKKEKRPALKLFVGAITKLLPQKEGKGKQ